LVLKPASQALRRPAGLVPLLTGEPPGFVLCEYCVPDIGEQLISG
jgi:hypothetical protein